MATVTGYTAVKIDQLIAGVSGGGGGGSSLTADDTPAKPAEGTYASYLVTSAVTWPAGLVWSTDPDGGTAPTITGTALVSFFTLGGVTRAVMGATFSSAGTTTTTTTGGTTTTTTTAATTTTTTTSGGPDTTLPTAGTLAASSIMNTGFTLTVTGAADETALDAAPYAFSTDNGSTWSAWQAAATYNATGLTASTGYDCVHKVRDAAANVATGTAITVTTAAAPSAAIVSDTFNREDASTLGTADTGQAWLAVTSQADYGIATNAAVPLASVNSFSWRQIDAGVSDVDVSVDITYRSDAAISVRSTNLDDHILFSIGAGGLTNGVNLAGAAQTPLTTYAFTPTAGQTYTLRVVAVGTAFTVYLDGVERMSGTITAHATATRHGLRCRSTSTKTRCDNFTISTP